MNISIIKNEEKTILALSGKLDTITSSKLQEILISELGSEKHVELDFSDLSYVTSAGLRILLMGEKIAKAQNSRQTLVNVSSEVMAIFEMTGFNSVLNFE